MIAPKHESLTDALYSHISDFRELAERARSEIENSLTTTGSILWKTSAEKSDTITQLLEEYNDIINERIATLAAKLAEAYTEAQAHRQEVSNTFVLLRGLLQVYSNLFLHGTTAPIIDVTLFSPPQSAISSARAYLQRIVDEYYSFGTALPIPELTVSKAATSDKEKLSYDSINVKALLSRKKGPVELRNSLVDTYLSDTKGIYNTLFQTLVRDYGEDVSPHASSLLATVTRLIDVAKPGDKDSCRVSLSVSDHSTHRIKRYYREKLAFHEGVISSHKETHQALENSMKIHDPASIQQLHSRMSLYADFKAMKHALSFLRQGEYESLKAAIEHLDVSITTGFNELPRTIFNDSLSYAAAEELDSRVQAQIKALTLIKEYMDTNKDFDTTALEQIVAITSQSIARTDEQLRPNLISAMQRLEERLMVEVGVCVSMGEDSPARRIVDTLQIYQSDPAKLLQDYFDAYQSAAAIKHYALLLISIVNRGDDDYQYLIDTVQHHSEYFDSSLISTLLEKGGSSFPAEASTANPVKKLTDQYRLLRGISAITAVSMASSSILSSLQKTDRMLHVPGISTIGSGTFFFMRHRKVPNTAICQEAAAICAALRPVVEPNGILAHTLQSATEAVQAASEGVKILVSEVFAGNKNARLIELSRAYEVRNNMRAEDIMGKIRRCFDTQTRAIAVLSRDMLDLMGRKTATTTAPTLLSLAETSLSKSISQSTLEQILTDGRQMDETKRSAIESFKHSRGKYARYLEELCQISKELAERSKQIQTIIESHNELCESTTSTIKSNGKKHIEYLQNLWNEAVVKYDQLAHAVYSEHLGDPENSIHFNDLVTCIDSCLAYSQLPPPQSVITSICIPFVKDQDQTYAKERLEMEDSRPQRPITVSVLSLCAKDSAAMVRRVIKALDTATGGTIFYGLEGSSSTSMESVYVKLHFSLRNIKFTFVGGSFSLKLSNIVSVDLVLRGMTHDNKTYSCLMLSASQTSYELYTRDENVARIWLCALRNVLAHADRIKTLRAIWLAGSQRRH